MSFDLSTVKCDYCGRYISYNDFVNEKAKRTLITPDSHFTKEEYEIYHVECKEKKK